jgi:hypothetical protein
MTTSTEKGRGTTIRRLRRAENWTIRKIAGNLKIYHPDVV